MLTSRQVVEAVTAPHTGVGNGKVAYLAAAEKRSRNRSTASERFLADLQAHRGPTSPVDKTYNHPATSPAGYRSASKGGPLSPSELVWLQRLPSDPAQVPHADAVTLARMVAEVKPQSHPDDARLLESVWSPVKAFHDRNAASVMLTNVSRALPTVPASALPALAEAIRAENDQLLPDEAIGRAGQMLRDATARHQAQRDLVTITAQQAIADIDSAAERRNAVMV